MTPPYDPETVALGVVGRPHGVHGELWLRPHNVQGRSFEGLRAFVLVRSGVSTSYQVSALRLTPDGALVKLAGIDTREAAAALTLSEVHVPRASLPALAPGEFYVRDVIGCEVVHEDGRALGVVASTFWNGAQDVMIVKAPRVLGAAPVAAPTSTGEPALEPAPAPPAPTPAIDEEHLIPLLPQFVVSVDAAGRKIVVSWDGGHD